MSHQLSCEDIFSFQQSINNFWYELSKDQDYFNGKLPQLNVEQSSMVHEQEFQQQTESQKSPEIELNSILKSEISSLFCNTDSTSSNQKKRSGVQNAAKNYKLFFQRLFLQKSKSSKLGVQERKDIQKIKSNMASFRQFFQQKRFAAFFCHILHKNNISDLVFSSKVGTNEEKLIYANYYAQILRKKHHQSLVGSQITGM